MATKVKATGSLLEKARAMPPKPSRNWFTKLDARMQAELLELRESICRGEITASKRSIYEQVVAPSGITIGQSAFIIWLSEGAKHHVAD